MTCRIHLQNHEDVCDRLNWNHSRHLYCMSQFYCTQATATAVPSQDLVWRRLNPVCSGQCNGPFNSIIYGVITLLEQLEELYAKTAFAKVVQLIFEPYRKQHGISWTFAVDIVTVRSTYIVALNLARCQLTPNSLGRETMPVYNTWH